MLILKKMGRSVVLFKQFWVMLNMIKISIGSLLILTNNLFNKCINQPRSIKPQTINQLNMIKMILNKKNK